MRIWLRLLLALALPAVALQGGYFFGQFWPEAKIYIKTSQTSRIDLQAAGTRTRSEGYTDGQYGAHMDFYFAPLAKGRVQRHPDAARSKMLMIRAGYYFAGTPHGSKDPWTEHTPLIEATPRFLLPHPILVEDRLRGDLRFIDGEFRPRFRERLRIERTFKLKRTAITPYGEFEAFYDWRYNSFHRQSYDAGAEWVLTRHFIFGRLLYAAAGFAVVSERDERGGGSSTSLLPVTGRGHEGRRTEGRRTDKTHPSVSIPREALRDALLGTSASGRHA